MDRRQYLGATREALKEDKRVLVLLEITFHELRRRREIISNFKFEIYTPSSSSLQNDSHIILFGMFVIPSQILSFLKGSSDKSFLQSENDEVVLQNRPLNSQTVADFLQKFNLKKTAIQKALDTLADSGKITFKEYGKQKIYLARQDQFQIPNTEELNQMKEENAKLQETLEEQKKVNSQLEGEKERGCLKTEEGREFELVFFRRLDFDFNKVIQFYQGKVKEAMLQAEELNVQIDALIAPRIKANGPHVASHFINEKTTANDLMFNSIASILAFNEDIYDQRREIRIFKIYGLMVSDGAVGRFCVVLADLCGNQKLLWMNFL
ncbi:hypothetical protein L1887_14621 [Cichorium endivia]|nr:hypothetical protein L1887_14621 [Cichorium endivia]